MAEVQKIIHEHKHGCGGCGCTTLLALAFAYILLADLLKGCAG